MAKARPEGKGRRAPRADGSDARGTGRGEHGRARVLLGVSGSIAAYKSCEVIRGLVKAGAEVKVVVTANAVRFVTPLTLSVLSRNPVYQDAFDPQAWDMAHLSLASWASRVVIAPASADLIARLAGGRSCGLLEALVLSTKAPVAIVPAMDTEMWVHRATRANVARAKELGYEIWGPVKGELASGRIGMGRLLEPAEIVARALA